MTQLKIVVIGVGSFVFGPSMLHQVILEHHLQDIELTLVNVDTEIVELMASVAMDACLEAHADMLPYYQ